MKVTTVSHQGLLEDVLGTLFSNFRGVKNTRKGAALPHPSTGSYLEVDVWYPDLHLCFEFQDEYHYRPVFYSHKPLPNIQNRDETKKNLILQRGETLIIVPCWWDGTSSSLLATICFYRPDLADVISLMPFVMSQSKNHNNINNDNDNNIVMVNHNNNDNNNNVVTMNNNHTNNSNGMIRNDIVIPANPPFNFFQEEDMQLMLVSFPSADHFNVNAHQWWVGEKYDGVRCCWKPNEKQLYTRHGRAVELHPSVTNTFSQHDHPLVALDGEVWSGRGSFQETNYLIQCANLDVPNWTSFRYLIK